MMKVFGKFNRLWRGLSGLVLIGFLHGFGLYADEPVFSGSLESNGALYNTTGDATDWSIEEFANLRMKAYVGEKGTVHAAVNAKAYSAREEELSTDGELERLYMTVREETIDIDAGFMRIPFGYGQAFKPSDFINTPDPVYPEARPKGALGAVVSGYFWDDTKLQLFGADRTNPYVYYPGYSRPLGGFAGELHQKLFSVQGTYAIQSPWERSSDNNVHRIGGSLKFDAILGFALDMLYTTDGGGSGRDGLELAFGADYSLLDGDLYLLAQYFYNGDGPLEGDESLDDLYGTSEWEELPVEERIPIEGYTDYYRRHYLYLSGTYSVSDYTRFILSSLFGMEDQSMLPALVFEHEPFQGLTVSLTGRLPIDPEFFGGSEEGELGAESLGYYNSILASAKMKF